MGWPESLQVALKEWAIVCRALESGRQMILLRKGGISESGGEFHVQNREFLLFPTFLHQNRNMLKPAEHAQYVAMSAEPEQIALASAGVVTDIVQLKSRQQVDGIDDEHVWTPPLIDMRFNYRPDNPLYLMLVRAYRLPAPVTITNTPAYAGCKSWVPLDAPVETSDTLPALDDGQFAARRRSILDRIHA